MAAAPISMKFPASRAAGRSALAPQRAQPAKKNGAEPAWIRLRRIWANRLAAATADRRVIHHHAASAAVLEHAGHAIATGLNHLTALAVAARAGHTDAVLGHLALAHAHRQVAAAHHHAVHHAAASAH